MVAERLFMLLRLLGSHPDMLVSLKDDEVPTKIHVLFLIKHASIFKVKA